MHLVTGQSTDSVEFHTAPSNRYLSIFLDVISHFAFIAPIGWEQLVGEKFQSFRLLGFLLPAIKICKYFKNG